MTAHPEPVLVPQVWDGSVLRPLEDCSIVDERVLAADSWLVVEGTALAIDMHRSRFLDAVGSATATSASASASASAQELDADAAATAADFWDAVIAQIPRTGEWFPRVDLIEIRGRAELRFRLRPSPERQRSVVVATHRGRDPRRSPNVKGPDLESMLRLRSEAQQRGATEAVIVSPEGYLTEGAYSALAWWRGEVLCFPAEDLDRIDSVTARILETLASVTGVDVVREHTTANEVDGLEVWAMSSLHGFRIVTGWIDGPATAELPGRLDLWRRRSEKLRRPLPSR